MVIMYLSISVILIEKLKKGEVLMDTVLLVAIFAGVFAVFDALRRINKNMLNQTEYIKEVLEELKRK